ncbi:MAG TPA: CRISPR-associated ring nuclease Csm6 [Deltaproteobacteria bacterium]|nr:CRISPR-associated ring nuclease Csm6 [Deltaproteobacteria bacterium]HQI80842.1 CRISPR-associated ring nuclease Csm6 [Deltaproteobacteria bacterium]
MKNILLAVLGMSPQVLTETLYALHHQCRPVHEIHVITTRSGRDKVFTDLLPPQEGRYHRFLEEYGIDSTSIRFDHEHVHAVTDRQGAPIDDILTEEHNEIFLRCCLETSFTLTRDPDTAVFFSIAGGRKTMSACLMVAAQLYGRPQDRVFHVLVTPDFESCRSFFYPTRHSSRIELRTPDGVPYFMDTKHARVILVPVPIVSIRGLVPTGLLVEPKDPATLMASISREEQPELIIDVPAAKVSYRGRELDMDPSHIALYASFALLKQRCPKGDASCSGCTDCYIDLNENTSENSVHSFGTQVADLYARVQRRRNREYEETHSGRGITRIDISNFKSYKSRIKDRLLGAFGDYALDELVITSNRRRGSTRYGIPMARDRIRVIL